MKTENAIKYKEKMNIVETIKNYTENEELRAVLNEYVTEKSLRYVQHSLNMLSKLTRDDDEKIAIVKQSLVNGWISFYKVADL